MTRELTAERLRALLHYEPSTGLWTWLIRPSQSVKVGDLAGCINKQGYREIVIQGKHYGSNRLAFLYMTGEWPDVLIDHEDTQRSNDRWSNLRIATRSQNNANSNHRKNQLGFKGIRLDKRSGKFHARLRKDGIVISLGYYATPEAAHAAYVEAAKLHHGEFARTA